MKIFKKNKKKIKLNHKKILIFKNTKKKIFLKQINK